MHHDERNWRHPAFRSIPPEDWNAVRDDAMRRARVLRAQSTLGLLRRVFSRK